MPHDYIIVKKSSIEHEQAKVFLIKHHCSYMTMNTESELCRVSVRHLHDLIEQSWVFSSMDTPVSCRNASAIQRECCHFAVISSKIEIVEVVEHLAGIVCSRECNSTSIFASLSVFIFP